MGYRSTAEQGHAGHRLVLCYSSCLSLQATHGPMPTGSPRSARDLTVKGAQQSRVSAAQEGIGAKLCFRIWGQLLGAHG